MAKAMRTAGWILVMLTCTLGAVDAFAQGSTAPANQATASDVSAARDLFREGARLAKEGKWAEACDRFERSFALRPSTLTRYGLAVAQKETGRLVEALENLRAFLRDPSDTSTADYQAPAQDLVRALETRVATLVVRSPAHAPAGLQVRVDGVGLLSAALGVKRPINPGHHKIEASAPGFESFATEFDLAEAGAANVVIVMRPEPTATGVAPASSAGSPMQPREAPEELGTRSHTTLGLTLAVAGGVLLVGGAAVGLAGVSKAKNAETSDGSDASSARKLAVVGDVVAGLGLVTAGVGAWLLLSGGAEKPAEAAPPRTAISPWVGSHAGGLSVGGAF